MPLLASPSLRSAAMPLAAALGAALLALRLRRRQASATAEARAAVLAGPGNRYAKEVQTAVKLALECGEAMRACLENKQVTWKDSSSIDPVTATDEENERRVTAGLKAAFPAHLIVGEEAAAAAGRIPPITDAPTWVVDPIDGTTNFVYGITLSCVSLGLCIKGEPVVGVVYEPYSDELFIAAKGEGAFLNGRPLKVGSARTLGEAMVLFELGYERSADGVDRMLGGLRALMLGGVRATRTIGTAVLSLCWVACGRASAYYTGLSGEGGKPWDYAAATVIAREAGAYFSNLQGAPFQIEGKSCVCASSEALARDIMKVLGTAER